jgi:hypothetical protein
VNHQPERHFVILADGSEYGILCDRYLQRRLSDDLVYHDFITEGQVLERWSQSDLDRIDELLAGSGETEGQMLRQPIWPVQGVPAPESVHGHELPARWRLLSRGEMAGLAHRVGVDTSGLGEESTAGEIRDRILDEIDWVDPT